MAGRGAVPVGQARALAGLGAERRALVAVVGSGEGGKALGGGWRVGTGTVLVWVTAGAFRVAGVLNRRGIGLVGLERLVVVLVVRGWCVRAGCGCGLVWVWGCRLGWFGLCGCFGERIFWRRRCWVGSHNTTSGEVSGAFGAPYG